MLHGIYGRGRNWQAIARELTAVRTDWSALLVDLRLHGESPAFEPPHTLPRAADDVRRLMATAGTAAEGPAKGPPVRAVLGHSFGGKVALAVAGGARAPDSLRQVWVIDAAPGTSEPRGSAWDMLEHVRSLPLAFPARADASQGLQRIGWAPDVANWMATNLRYADDEFRWALDFDALESMLRSYFATDLWPVVESPPDGIDIHIVKAEESSVLDEDACVRIERAGAATGRVHLHRAAGGHWVHAENPRVITSLLARFLPPSA